MIEERLKLNSMQESGILRTLNKRWKKLTPGERDAWRAYWRVWTAERDLWELEYTEEEVK